MRRGAERPHTLLRHSNQLYRPAMAVSPEAATRPFNGHLTPAGVGHKIEGGGGTVATGTQHTGLPRPQQPCPVWVEQVDHERSPRTTRSFYGLPTGRITVQALVSIPSRAMEG